MLRSAPLICAVLITMIAGCEGAVRTSDPRFSTPERTVATLLASYELDRLSQEEVRERIAAHRRFELADREAFEACFADFGAGPAIEGLAGWVLGALAAGKDELRTTITGDRATVSPREGVRIVMRLEDGAWRIVIAESVPEDVRRAIAAVGAEHERRLRRGIAHR